MNYSNEFDPHESFTKDVVASIMGSEGTATIDRVTPSVFAWINYKMPGEDGQMREGRIGIDAAVPYTRQIADINRAHGLVLRVTNPELLGLSAVEQHALGLVPSAS